jgi:hypothetical protein
VVCFNENKVIGPFFFFEEPTVTGDTFPTVMESTAVHHVPKETVFQSDGTPPHLSCYVMPFWTGSFLIVE